MIEPQRQRERSGAGLILVKLGGSLITDKGRAETARPEVIRRLAGEVAAGHAETRLVLGHGSGSFGHRAAARHRIQQGIEGPEQVPGVAHTQARARELHRRVVEALEEAGVAPYSLPPSALMVAEDGRIRSAFVEPFLAALDLGLLPVVYGDVVMDRRRGASICSTEQALYAVADRLLRRRIPVKRAIWLGETLGVLDGEGRVVEHLTPERWRRLRRHVGGAAGVDVTGGMRLRVETALQLAARGVESVIADGRVEGLLLRALVGEPVKGTLVTTGSG